MADIRGGVASSNPEYLTPHEPSGKMFFAQLPNLMVENYVTDGTQKGTKLVEDIFVGEMGSNPKFLTLKNSTSLSHTIFSSEGSSTWRGTVDKRRVTETRGNDNLDEFPGSGKGTQLVKDIRPGSGGSKPHHLVMYDSKLLF